MSERIMREGKARYEGGYSGYNKKSDGSLCLTDKRITFKAREFSFEIPLERLVSLERIEKKKISKKKTVIGVTLAPFTFGASLGLIAWRDKVRKIIVGFMDEKGGVHAPIFDVGKHYEEWKNLIDDLAKAKEQVSKSIEVEEQVRPSVVTTETVKLAEKPIMESVYGKVLKSTRQGRYYGGHKAYLAGGLISKEDTGDMFLTEEYLVFVKSSLTGKGRYRIVVPLRRVEITGWDVKDEARRKSFIGSGLGGFPFGLLLGGGLFGGIMHEEGKRHEIVLPYIDENGIPQMPRFAIGSVLGGAVKEWAKAIYDRIVELHKERSVAVVPSITELICPKCGKKVSSEFNICPYCGFCFKPKCSSCKS